MKRLLDAIHALATWGSVLSFTAMILVVALQVFARFALAKAPPWTEEVSRICFIYMVAFGIGLAVRADGLVKLDLLGSYKDRLPCRLLQCAIELAITAFAFLLCFLSWRFASNGQFEKSPSLELSMAAVFASMTLLSLSIALFSFEKLLLSFRRLKPR